MLKFKNIFSFFFKTSFIIFFSTSIQLVVLIDGLGLLLSTLTFSWQSSSYRKTTRLVTAVEEIKKVNIVWLLNNDWWLEKKPLKV